MSLLVKPLTERNCFCSCHAFFLLDTTSSTQHSQSVYDVHERGFPRTLVNAGFRCRDFPATLSALGKHFFILLYKPNDVNFFLYYLRAQSYPSMLPMQQCQLGMDWNLQSQRPSQDNGMFIPLPWGWIMTALVLRSGIGLGPKCLQSS